MYFAALLISLGLLLLSGYSAAQPSEPLNPLERHLENIKENHLAAAIGVDQDTVQRLLDIDRRYKAQRSQMLREMRDDLKRLQQLLHQPRPSEEEVRQVLNLMFQKRQNTLNLQQQQLQEEMAVLTPVQQGRYLLFLIGLRQQMAKEARNLRNLPQGSPPFQQGVRGIPVVQPGR